MCEFKLEKEYKAVYCHLAYLSYTQSTSCQMSGWIESKSRIKIAWRNINNLRCADDTILMAESKEELNNFSMKVKEKRVKKLA